MPGPGACRLARASLKDMNERVPHTVSLGKWLSNPTILPPGSSASADAVVHPPGANGDLAAQTPALGRPLYFRPG